MMFKGLFLLVASLVWLSAGGGPMVFGAMVDVGLVAVVHGARH